MTATVGLYRARLGLLAAALASVVALVCWFPLGELLHQRGELASLASQSSSIDAHNAQLQNEVTSLQQNANIETIAHEQFGLVEPGQESFVILPKAGSTTGAPGLRQKPIPETDLVADPVEVAPTPLAKASGGQGFEHRFLSSLEFWRN